jgi:hypothetical protein
VLTYYKADIIIIISLKLIYVCRNIAGKFLIAISMKQQSAGRHAAALGNIIPIPNQPAFALTLQCCALITEITNTNVIVFRLTRPTKYNFPY